MNDLFRRAHAAKKHADATNDPCAKAHRYLRAVLDYTKAVALSNDSCDGTQFAMRSSEHTISLLRHVKRILSHSRQHVLHDGAPPGSELNTRTRHERRKLYLVLQVMLYAYAPLRLVALSSCRFVNNRYSIVYHTYTLVIVNTDAVQRAL